MTGFIFNFNWKREKWVISSIVFFLENFSGKNYFILITKLLPLLFHPNNAKKLWRCKFFFFFFFFSKLPVNNSFLSLFQCFSNYCLRINLNVFRFFNSNLIFISSHYMGRYKMIFTFLSYHINLLKYKRFISEFWRE